MLEKVVELAEQITDEEQRIFTLSGVIVASDKFINREHGTGMDFLMDRVECRLPVYVGKESLLRAKGNTVGFQGWFCAFDLRFTESTFRPSGNCFRQTYRKSQRTKRTLTTCSCFLSVTV